MLAILEDCFLILFTVIVVTQVALPLMTNRPLFPFLRPSRGPEATTMNEQLDAARARRKMREVQGKIRKEDQSK